MLFCIKRFSTSRFNTLSCHEFFYINADNYPYQILSSPATFIMCHKIKKNVQLICWTHYFL